MTAYIQLALQNHVPAMIFRMDEAAWRATGMDAETAGMASQVVRQLEEMGMPLLDAMLGLPLDNPYERLDQAKKAFSSLGPGVTHFIIHPSKDTPELRAITGRPPINNAGSTVSQTSAATFPTRRWVRCCCTFIPMSSTCRSPGPPSL